jgi:membrane-bound ClpP family serine protease
VSERDEDGDDEVVGQIGTAISDLRPSGKVTVQGQRYDAVAQLGFVMRGTPVQVVRRQGYQLVVKPQRDDSESYSDPGSTEEQA